MDPITIGAAFLVAEESVKAVKRGIALGKDIYAVSGDLMKFFNAKSDINKEVRRHEAEKAAAMAKDAKAAHKDYYELTAEAMDTVLKVKRMKHFENELMTTFIWSGEGDTWREIVKERARLEKEQEAREAQERLEKLAQEKAAAEAKELHKELSIFLAVALVIGVAFWQGVSYAIDQGWVLSGPSDHRVKRSR